MEILILPAALGLIVLLWFMGTYNGLIRLRMSYPQKYNG